MALSVFILIRQCVAICLTVFNYRPNLCEKLLFDHCSVGCRGRYQFSAGNNLRNWFETHWIIGLVLIRRLWLDQGRTYGSAVNIFLSIF